MEGDVKWPHRSSNVKMNSMSLRNERMKHLQAIKKKKKKKKKT